jgi:glycosyltransferase involved in cell wall biosynthesis
MRIAWVSHEANLDGAERCLLEAARGLVSGGHEVQAILPWTGDLEAELARIPVAVRTMHTTWWAGTGPRRTVRHRMRRLCRNLLGAPGLCRLLRQIRPDLVVSNTITIPMGAFAARQAGIPHVWYLHELGIGRADHHLSLDLGHSLSRSLIDRLSDRIIVCSRAVQQRFVAWFDPEKVRVVYSAVEIPIEPTEIVDDRRVMTLILVGRMDPLKRQADAIRAVALLAGKGLQLRLRLVGREIPEYGAFLRQLVRERDAAEYIELVPFAENPFPHVARSDVALMCSQDEGFGRVTVEAMKLGKPVIGADSAGTSELIRDGWNGFLYRPGDIDDLARKIDTLYHDRTLLREMGEHAREWSKQTFSMGQYTSDLLRVFDEALTLHAPRGTRPDGRLPAR